MRKNLLLIFGLPGILLSACSQPGYDCVNPSASDVTDKLFVLDRAEVAKLASFGDSDFIRVSTASGDLLPSQMDDLDGDGRWDELAFMIDLKANEKCDCLVAQRLHCRNQEHHLSTYSIQNMQSDIRMCAK